MARALQLAERGLYTTAPNPNVGCVLVLDGNVVGEGWHQRAGGAHAEVNALQQAGDKAHGATAYVSLEPCCHHGRTPPCTEALIKAGIRHVVVAMQDPNPQVSGKGLAQLQAAGIDTSGGLMQAQAEALNAGFIMRMRQGRPLVRCKMAMSLDGRTAMASGESKWITGTAARQQVHRLRARSGAIMTGIGTVLADDPSLNVRLQDNVPEGGWIQPIRVILDPNLNTPADARLLQQAGRTIIVTAVQDTEREAELQRAGAELVFLPSPGGRIDLPELLTYLGNEQINEVLLETGATLSGAMLNAGLVDELKIYMAPHLMGNAARGLFELPGLQTMDQRIDLHIRDVRAVGDDWCITAGVKRKE
jgi:diaminohydroxyphosphoribosylaminopyrimidine deaminase/5-amino-6-(5-phosphoribosylamino)uracil reductase